MAGTTHLLINKNPRIESIKLRLGYECEESNAGLLIWNRGR